MELLVRENIQIDFKRGVEPDRAMRIGKYKKVLKGDRIEFWNFYDNKMMPAIATSDEYVDNDDSVINIEFEDDGMTVDFWAYWNPEKERWTLGEN